MGVSTPVLLSRSLRLHSGYARTMSYINLLDEINSRYTHIVSVG